MRIHVLVGDVTAMPTEALVTAAPVRWVVHAVGPRYGVDEPAAELLASAYLEALRRCDEVGARSVSFPALSTGAYGYPAVEAARVSVATLRAAPTGVRECLLVAFDRRTAQLWASELAR